MDKADEALGKRFALKHAMADMHPNLVSASAGNGAGDNPPGSGGIKKPAVKSKGLVYIAALLAVAAAGIYFRFHASAAASAPAAAAVAETTLPLETFVVNLNGASQRAYLRVGITLGVSRPLPHDSRGDAPVAPLRDTILSVLASAQPEPLLTAEGKQKLKADLLKALQDRAPELGIQDVYFTEFLVQM